jgi:hypothetical protein
MADLKTYNGLAKASVKTFNGLAVASWKSWNGLLIPSAAGGAAFSDDFAGTGTLGANWTVTTGTWGRVSGQCSLSSIGGCLAGYTGTACTTLDQYVKATLSTISSSYPALVFRRENGTPTNNYYVYKDGLTIVWANDAGGSIQSASMSLSNGDSLGITVTGTGSSTIVRVWKNPAANTPTSLTVWGGASPDVTFTNNSSVASDSGTTVGLGGNNQSSLIYDDFFGGDVPA